MNIEKYIGMDNGICHREAPLTAPAALGSRGEAIYTVKTGDIVITADSPRRAMLRRAGRIQYSNIIRGNLRTEELNGEGNVQVVPDENFKREIYK